MLCSRNLLLLALIAPFLLGCGKSGYVKAVGHIVKGGQPFRLDEGQSLRLFFAPSNTQGSRYDSFAASFNPDDGSFEVLGKDGEGLPPGTYQVGLQLMQGKEDQLSGRLLGPKSGITLEVAPGSKDLVIDLDKTPFDKAFAAGPKPSTKSKRR
jgi:hypothetical protein